MDLAESGPGRQEVVCAWASEPWGSAEQPGVFWPSSCELRASSASSGPRLGGVPGSALMRVPEQSRLSTQHWNPSTPSYLPGQTLSLTSAVLT